MDRVGNIVNFMEDVYQTMYVNQALILYTKASCETSDLIDHLKAKDYPVYWLLDTTKYFDIVHKFRVFVMSGRGLESIAKIDRVNGLSTFSIVLCLDEDAYQTAKNVFKSLNVEKIYIFSCHN
jgi:hypothetical protein